MHNIVEHDFSSDVSNLGDDGLVELSVLDYAVIDEGKSAEEALQDTVKLAKLADKLNFKRFWLTEHHDVPAFACSSPELMMMHLLSETKRIKLGSGGVMLPHYSPYKIAENFRLLEGLFPNRTDLGIGSNLGTAIVKRALNEGKTDFLDYEQSIKDIRHYITNQDESQRYKGLIAQPHLSHHSDMWLLCTSAESAQIAAEQGIGLTLGTFLLPNQAQIDSAKESVDTYRKAFNRTSLNLSPTVMITTFVIVTDTEQEAEDLLQSLDVWLLGKKQFAEFSRFPSIETAKSYKLSERDQHLIEQHRARVIAGTKEQVKLKIDRLVEDFQANEVLLVPLHPGIKQRCRTLELLSEIYL